MANPHDDARPGQAPICEAIQILTEEADTIRATHTHQSDRDDWAGEPEAKADYDRMLGVAAALSKLRAEGVQAGVPMLPSDALDALRDFKLTVIQDGFHRIGKPMIQQLAQAGALESLGFGKHRVTEYGEWLLSSSSAALASAPVAGETQPVCWIERAQLESVRDEGNDAWVYWRETGHAAEPDEVPLYAAPQASEAARDVNALMAAEYQQGINWFHKGRDYDSFLMECALNKPQADKARAAVAAPPTNN